MLRIAMTLVTAAVLVQTSPRPLTIDFVALDRNGRPVADLKPTEVEVWIGQFRAPVERMTVVSPGADERDGRFIVLLLDDMTLPLPMLGRAHEAARRFAMQMGANDRMAVLTLTGTEMQPTADRATLLRAIDAYTVRATPVMRTDTLGRHVLDTLAAISQQVREVPGRRKVIVGIGTGGLFDRPIPNPLVGQDLLPEWIHAMSGMALSNVNFYVIDPGGVGTSRVDDGDQGFARETGGHAFLNTNDLNGAVDRILRESASFYMVEVPDPPVGGKADLRPLEIKSRRKGVTVRARHAIPGSF
jgi:VWFA-related protein